MPKAGDIITFKGKQYKVTDKHPRPVRDMGFLTIRDPKAPEGFGYSWTPNTRLIVIPVEEYDEFMKNYPHVEGPKFKEVADTGMERLNQDRIPEDEHGKYMIVDGKKIRL